MSKLRAADQKGYTLECAAAFLAEEWSKVYKKYSMRVPEAKMLLCAKNALQAQTCFELGRHGV